VQRAVLYVRRRKNTRFVVEEGENMHPNAQRIQEFYAAFQRLDAQAMAQCYADTATFSDPVFANLHAAETRAMWAMLTKRAKNFELSYANIQADDHKGSADWEAKYDFSASGRRVHNIIHAEFVIEQGKIVRHSDTFDMWRWARQALGITGWLLGWSGFFQRTISNQAMKSLQAYMRKNG